MCLIGQRVPRPFDRDFGGKLPSKLWIRCKANIWSAKYDRERKCIYGLRTFVTFYGIRIFGIVQFNYYGDGMFSVKIFKESVVECNYPLSNPKEYKKVRQPKHGYQISS